MTRDEYDIFFLKNQLRMTNSILKQFPQCGAADIILDTYIKLEPKISNIDKTNAYNYFITSSLNLVREIHNKKVSQFEKKKDYKQKLKNELLEDNEFDKNTQLYHIYNIINNEHIIDPIAGAIIKQHFFGSAFGRKKNGSQLLKPFKQISVDLNLEQKYVQLLYYKNIKLIKRLMSLSNETMGKVKMILNEIAYFPPTAIPSATIEKMLAVYNEVFNTNYLYNNCPHCDIWATYHNQLKNVYAEEVRMIEKNINTTVVKKKHPLEVVVLVENKEEEADVIVETNDDDFSGTVTYTNTDGSKKEATIKKVKKN